MRVQDKSIIVTGSGSGIGAGIAQRLSFPSLPPAT